MRARSGRLTQKPRNPQAFLRAPRILRGTFRPALLVAAFLTLVVVALNGQSQPPPSQSQGGSGEQSFRFKSGVELVNVTATVTDSTGRFVSGLRQDDFVVYEDDQPQTVTHFSSDRVPVSLGVALDTSASMAGEKIESARSALDRFMYDLLSPQDEIFLYRFSNDPVLLQSWTTDRQLLSRALSRLSPHGGTALYDAVAEAIPLTQKGQNRKKALVLLTDGNDTSSTTRIRDVQQLIRESETMVYAIGIDCSGGITPTRRARDLAAAFGLPLTVEDSGGGDVVTAASMHLNCSLPPKLVLSGYLPSAMVVERFATGTPAAERGRARLPAGPGLGIEVDEAAVGEPVLRVE